MILAPLRGVTVRCFRETFAAEIAAAGFTEAVTPFVTATAGFDPMKDRELRGGAQTVPFRVTPQFIGKDPAALGTCLQRIRAAGYATADLNAGCPFPMVRNKGRGSGLLKTPAVLREMLEVGCATMGEGNFSVKARLGVDRPDELLALMPLLNAFPLRRIVVHARTARQMYAGACDWEAYGAIRRVAAMPVVPNGDLPADGAATSPSPRDFSETSSDADGLPFPAGTRTSPPRDVTRTSPPRDVTRTSPPRDVMVGRAFVRALGARADAPALFHRYLKASQAELSGDRSVLGRMKELLTYWKDLPRWKRLWPVMKLARTCRELASCVKEES